jgi:hypothetical protein
MGGGEQAATLRVNFQEAEPETVDNLQAFLPEKGREAALCKNFQ